MSFLWIGWEVLINVVEEGMFCYLLIKQLGHKKEKIMWPYWGLAILVLFTTILNITIHNSNIVIFILFIADIIYAITCFNSSFSSRFFWGGCAAVIGTVSNTIVYILASAFTSFDLSTLTIPSLVRIQMTLIYLVICSVIYFIMIEVTSKKTILLPRMVRIFLFLLLSLGIVASDKLIDFSISLHIAPTYSNQGSSTLGFIGIVYLSVLLGCIILFEVLGDYYQKNATLTMQLREANLVQNHFENIQASMKTLRQWKHDYHHHIQAMQLLAEKDQNAELKSYLTELNSTLTDVTAMVSTGHPTLDAILSSKILIAKSNGIAVEQVIFLPETLTVPQTDLCVILGNLLDNAIEACKKINLLQPPYINITIKIHKDMLYFKIINSSNGVYAMDHNRLLSTKKQAEHGYGFKSINKIVDHYGGFSKYEPQESSFAATIMIPMEGKEAI